VKSCDTFTTDGFFKPDSLVPISTFPGASARERLLVMTAVTTVWMRLRLKAFD
jgi:hypothetical protein